MNKDEAEQFEKAFSMHISGPVSSCACGRIFWDSYNSGYDWGEGEQDSLRANAKATAVGWGVERIMLEGTVYCMDCDCWHGRAQRIADWLREHQGPIGCWFSLEKQRLAKAADDVPVITAPEESR